ncbi:MAG: nitroreductase family deazaflavin-dependent oxidoreductase [Chloroflexales bacterium]|nr:nitroreductase family deazaflavin-dependent oxidoreductase [Chloroflexales bacterium]
MQNLIHRMRDGLFTFGGTRFGAWLILRFGQPLDHLFYRWSGGRVLYLNVLRPVLMLTTTGAKSGQPRDVPLIYMRDGPRIVVLASNYGRTYHPAWYLNLRANPACQARISGRAGAYIAREAEGRERDELWRRAVVFYPGYRGYEARAERCIPIIVLEPTA